MLQLRPPCGQGQGTCEIVLSNLCFSLVKISNKSLSTERRILDMSFHHFECLSYVSYLVFTVSLVLLEKFCNIRSMIKLLAPIFILVLEIYEFIYIISEVDFYDFGRSRRE